jgi:hypothetical protein
MFGAQMSNLPPDLQRLGDELAGAAARAATADRLRREGRRRLALTAVVGALVFATLTPGALGPANREVRLAALPQAGLAPPGCDQPRGARFTLPACADGKVLRRPYAWR